LEIEDEMLVKINQQIAGINMFKTQYEDAVKKLAEAKENEKMSSYGIMDDSIIRVTISEASGIIQAASFFVSITVGKENKYTKTLPRTLKPYWDEELML
jgi:hypothetical protein